MHYEVFVSVAILGGDLKNLKLKVSNSGMTRPTSVILKRKLFDSYQSMEGYCFIDLCCGSGQVGIEALSRGAHKVYLVEKERKVFQILKDNYLLLKKRDESLAEKVTLSSMDSIKWMQIKLPEFNLDEKYFIFLDPPYKNHELYKKCLVMLNNIFLDGVLCIESDKLIGPSVEFLREHYGPEFKLFEHSDSFLYLVDLRRKGVNDEQTP